MRNAAEYDWYKQLIGGTMEHTIQKVKVPSRSRLWTTEEADQVFKMLTEDNEDQQAVQYGTYAKVRNAKNEPQKGDEEQKARTQGNSLNNLIEQRHSKRFGVTVYEDGDHFVGALLPREAKKNTGKAASGQNSGNSGSRQGRQRSGGTT